MPLARLMQLTHLRRAAHCLVSREFCSVLDAAFDAESDSHEAFSRAFGMARVHFDGGRIGRYGARLLSSFIFLGN